MTTFSTLYIGTLPDVDPSDDLTFTNLNGVLGSYGTPGQPLADGVTEITSTGTFINNNGTGDTISYDLGGGPVVTQMDSYIFGDSVDITFADGTVTNTSVFFIQDMSGETFMAVHDSQASLVAQPIASINILSVSSGPMGVDHTTLDDNTFASTAGDDTITGTGGDEQLIGGAGADTIDGGGGADTIYGGDADDIITGGAGDDVLDGGAGDDSLIAGTGDDSITGGDGSDTLVFSNGDGADTFDGGSGGSNVDVVDLSAVTGGVVMNSSGVTAGTDQLSFTNIEWVIGTGEDDIITFAGSGNAITIEAGAGDDYVIGSNAADAIYGEAGSDSLHATGDGAADLLDGGEGNDFFYVYGGAGDDTLVGGGGTDRMVLTSLPAGVTITYSAPYAGTITDGTDTITFSEIEIFDLTGQADVVYGGTTFLNLYAGGGDDTLYGSTQNDGIFAGTGDDFISGGDGRDHLRGSDGADTIEGGAGGDWLYGGDDDDIIDGGAGDDDIEGEAGDDTLTGGAGDDTITTGAGDDVVVLEQNGGHDTVTDFDIGDTNGDGSSNDQLDVSDLRDLEGNPINIWDVVVSDDGSGNAVLTFPEGETLTLQGISPAQMTSQQMIASGIPCFTPGTLIRTPTGDVAVEDLKIGDRVETQDHGAQPIRYVSSQDITGPQILENHLPILISAGSLGANVPKRDLVVSGQHRMLLSWLEVRKLHDEGEVLAPAKALIRLRGIRVKRGVRKVQYIHLLFDRHEVIFAEGAPTESFYPGPTMLRDMRRSEREALFQAVPELRKGVEAALGKPARKLLRVQETTKLVRDFRLRRNHEISKWDVDLAMERYEADLLRPMQSPSVA